MRTIILGAAALVMATQAGAQQTDFSKVQIKTTKTADRFVGQFYQELKTGR
jgi:hypothetical protein